jgi:hypothetical protein
MHPGDTLMAHGRRTLAILGIAAAAALAAAASAGAGGGGTVASGLWVCGPHGVAHLTGAIEKRVPTKYDPSLKAAGPAAPHAFYRADLNGSTTCAVDQVSPLAYFIPATGEVRIEGKAIGSVLWVKLAPDVAAELRKAVDKVKPYRAPTKLTSALINDQSVVRPSSYLRLYTIGRPVKRAPKGIHWLYISLFRVGPPSPWTDRQNNLFVSRRGHNYLKRDGQIVRIAASVAARIRRAAPIPR